MKSTTLGVIMTGALLLAGFTNQASAEIFNFDSDPTGALPPGWTSTMTHAGGAPKWEVRPDNTAPSKPNGLAQLSNDPTDGRFPLAILDKANFKDGELSVRTRAISGHVDQGAGLVWRYRDPNNYYLVRAYALEDNVVLYKVEKGRRSSIAPKGTASFYSGSRSDICGLGRARFRPLRDSCGLQTGGGPRFAESPPVPGAPEAVLLKSCGQDKVA